jgi:hypothetical protein
MNGIEAAAPGNDGAPQAASRMALGSRLVAKDLSSQQIDNNVIRYQNI